MDPQALHPHSRSDAELLLEHVESLAQIGTWELNLETEKLYWSDGIFKLLGYAPQAFEPTFETGIALIHPEDRERAVAHMHEVLQNDGLYEIQKRLLTKDGSIRHVRSRASLIKNKAGKVLRLVGIFQDITDFVATQLALSKKEEHLKTIIQSEPECVKIVSVDGKLLDMNPAGLEMIEASGQLETLLGKPVEALIHQEDRESFRQLHAQALAGQEAMASFRIMGLQGTERLLESKSVPLRDEQDKVYAVLSLTRDITQRARLESELACSEKRFRSLVENSADAIAIIAADSSATYVSPSITRVLGYTEAEAMQLRLFDFVHPHDAETVAERFGAALQNPGVPIHAQAARIRHKDGSWRWLDATLTNLLHDPVINGIIDNFRDVTETKELQLLLDNASKLARVGGWEIDLLNEVHNWSPVTCEIHEVPHDFSPNFDNAFDFYKETHRALVKKYVDTAIEQNQPFDFEAPLITAQGHERWVRAIGHGEWVDGQCVRIFGSFQDIQDRKMLELELQRKIQELAVSNQELEQFAYIASHDLQEPLRMVDSFLGLLEKRYGHQLDSKAQQYIHFATDGARRMRQVILALLDFSRVGKEQDKLSHFALEEVLTETLALKRKLIQEKGALVTYADLPSLTSYRTPVQQVLYNLIENALKYSKKEDPPVIEIQSQEHLDEWEITVKDNGIGIAPEFYNKIFIIFQRLHLKHEYSGTGMGLAIVKKIVEGLGGRVWVDSVEEVGSTFGFTLKKNPVAQLGKAPTTGIC